MGYDIEYEEDEYVIEEITRITNGNKMKVIHNCGEVAYKTYVFIYFYVSFQTFVYIQ